MGAIRQIVFGILPDGKSHATYSWPMLEDGNEEGRLITCAHCPTEKTNVYRTSQDQVFLGTKEAHYVIRTFAEEYGYDGYDPISAEFITNRIDPSLLIGSSSERAYSDQKRFLKISFFDTNPFDNGVELSYCRDVTDPLQDNVTWLDIEHHGTRSRASFPRGIARWVNLRGVDQSVRGDNATMGAFLISFYRLYNREKESE